MKGLNEEAGRKEGGWDTIAHVRVITPDLGIFEEIKCILNDHFHFVVESGLEKNLTEPRKGWWRGYLLVLRPRAIERFTIKEAQRT